MDKNSQPLVSVIVPSYNHEGYISQCIESIVKQTYNNFDLIVIDDGSKDESRKILEELKLRYDFTLVFQENSGISRTLNRGIQEFANGQYISFCASDDYWSHDKLEKQVFFMEKNKSYPMCYGKTHYVDEESKLIEEYDFRNESLKGGWIFDDIISFKFHPPVNYMFRAEIFKEVGLHNEDLVAEDFDMNLRIASKYPIGYLDEYLGYYRITDNAFKVIRFDKVSDSHLKSIEQYKTQSIYKYAKRLIYLRKFFMFSDIRSLKLKALKNMFKSINLFYTKKFILSLFRLCFIWKKEASRI